MAKAPLSTSSRLRRRWALLVLLIQLPFVACGGGGAQNLPPPPPADFTLTVNPTTVSIPPGGSASASLSATALNGFLSQVSVQVTGLPSGVIVTPASITLTPGTPLQLTLSAANGAAAATTTATFTGSSATLAHSTSLGITVTRGSSGHISTRTRYVRTDAVTEYFAWLNTHWVVYHSPTSHFFVTDPQAGRVTVLDANSETQIASINVPGAFGLDETPDHGTLYVGSLIGDVYAIDPVAMKIKRRYLASQIGPYGGYQAFTALVLADGRLALLGAQGGIPSVDGSSSIAIWNPIDNSLTIYGAPTSPGVPSLPVCSTMGNIGGFTRSADRTAILIGSIDSDGTLCEINPTTGQKISVVLGGFSTTRIITSPDGRYIVFPAYPDHVVLYDAQTLNQVASFGVLGDTSSASGLAFSADSKTLFVPSENIVFAYDVATHQQIGWFPNIFLPPTSGGFAVGPINSPDLQAVDGTGLLAGPLEEGFGFVDSAALLTGSAGTSFTNAYLNPATGPAAGGTPTQLSAPATLDASSDIFFGKNRATALSKSGFIITATTPPGAPGVVDVYAFANDGGMQLVPDGFSYGPTILQVTPDNSTAEGGGAGIVYGYGFGPVGATTIPPGLSVSVGGKSATVIGFNPNAYNLSSPPYLLQSVSYVIPSGSTGSADVTVTSSSGSATVPGALTYLPVIRRFPLQGSALVQGIYDPYRDLYYFTDASKIQVFSLAQGKWLSPINIPAPPGTTQRLWGLSLSPNGNKLAVADASAGVIYLVDPLGSSPVKTFPLTVSNPGGIITKPGGVAISDAGIVYCVVFVQGGTGFGNYFKLDTNTGVLTDYHITGPGLGASDAYLRTTLSSDNARVYFNNLGYVFSIDTATDQIFPATTGPGCCYGNYELALSRNQTQFAATGYLYDSDLNGQSYYTVNDREVLGISYVYGTKLSPDGSLAFQPASNGLDIFDGRLGNLRGRIALPVALSPNYDALVEDGKDNVLIAITGAQGDGVAIIDLTSVHEPPPLLYAPAVSSQETRLHVRSALRTANLPLAAQPNAKANPPVSRPRVIPHITNLDLLKAN